MNKILNWTLGSFFRTLGRIIVYILIGYVLFNLIDLKSLPNIFGVLDVKADTISVGSNDEESYAYLNSTLFYMYQNLDSVKQNYPSTFRLSITTLESIANEYNFIQVDVCSSEDIWAYRTSSAGESCTNSCFSQEVLIEKTNYQCTTGGWNGTIRRISVPISKWGSGVDTETKNINDRISIATNFNATYAPLTVYGIYLSNTITSGLATTDYTDTLNAITANNNQQQEWNRQNATNNANAIINSQNQINSNITDETGPNLSGLNNSAGWLPAGPVDSILTLPLSFLNNLSSNLSKTCTPINLPLPYVNKTLELPCLNSVYAQINGLPVWLNTIGTIASAFILFSYFINLYKYIDDTLTFRENNYIDNWSGV